jgi:predicted Zn-dependent protease
MASPVVTQESPFERAMRESRFAEAAQIARAAMAEDAQDAVAAFDLARALARAGELDEAIEALLESARRSFAGVRSLADDAHLDALRALAGRLHRLEGEMEMAANALLELVGAREG